MINKINPEIIKIMDKQERFFKVMLEHEQINGRDFIVSFLNQSQAINNSFTARLSAQNKNKLFDLEDKANLLFFGSLNRVVTKEEHIQQILDAFDDYKIKGSWKNDKETIKRLIKAQKLMKRNK